MTSFCNSAQRADVSGSVAIVEAETSKSPARTTIAEGHSFLMTRLLQQVQASGIIAGNGLNLARPAAAFR